MSQIPPKKPRPTPLESAACRDPHPADLPADSPEPANEDPIPQKSADPEPSSSVPEQPTFRQRVAQVDADVDFDLIWQKMEELEQLFADYLLVDLPRRSVVSNRQGAELWRLWGRDIMAGDRIWVDWL